MPVRPEELSEDYIPIPPIPPIPPYRHTAIPPYRHTAIPPYRRRPWLTECELALYAAEYQRHGFQGGLQWYRCGAEPRFTTELQTWAGRSIDVPSMFIAGQSDWGTYQKPGEFEKMQRTACTDMRSVHLVEGAGHWVQQEQPGRVTPLLLEFLSGL